MIKSFKIILPRDREVRNRLRKKLIEYEKRVIRLKKKSFSFNPDLAYNSLPGYKALILRHLYHGEEVRTDQLARELKEEFGRLDTDMFNSAARVISDYCRTGGKNVKNGTGF